MALEPGSILNNRYRIEEQLGKGGMGTVYFGFDQTLQIRVAVKENMNTSDDSERQFKVEARLLASLRHPNLPRVTDHFILEGRQYLVMDFIEGEDLHAVSRRRPADVAEVIRWADGACDALSYLHRREPPIIHRDIKPGNLKLQPDGKVMLVDFGIAKEFDKAQMTTTGARGLTPGYSPPEQYGGARTDARSDQYALAATVYTLLTGRSPEDSIERMLKKTPLQSPRKLNENIPKHVEAALIKALELDPDDRLPDIATFKAALHGAFDAKTVVRESALVEPKRRSLPVPLIIGAAILGLIVIAGGIGVAVIGGGLLGSSSPTETVLAVAVASTETPTLTHTIPPPPDTPTLSPTPTATITPTETFTPQAAVIGGGGRIAFVSDRGEGFALQIWTMNTDGSDPRQVTFGPFDKLHPNWSPDGRRMLFVSDGGGNLGSDIFVINEDGSGFKNITQSVGEDIEPVWSGEGTQIAFTSDRNTQVRQIYIMDASCIEQEDVNSCAAVKPKRISCATMDFCPVEYSPAWSPVDNTIAVSVSINDASPRIYFRSAAGGDVIQFDRSGTIVGADHLAWSPDGQFLAFTWIQPTSNEIYSVPKDDPTRWVKLTNTIGNKDPAFSPDGQWIIFTSTRDQNSEIYLMSANGANEFNLTNDPSHQDLQPSWQPVP
jgi:serine/threonine protein kinase/Tol biopolymer transport system component